MRTAWPSSRSARSDLEARPQSGRARSRRRIHLMINRIKTGGEYTGRRAPPALFPRQKPGVQVLVCDPSPDRFNPRGDLLWYPLQRAAARVVAEHLRFHIAQLGCEWRWAEAHGAGGSEQRLRLGASVLAPTRPTGRRDTAQINGSAWKARPVSATAERIEQGPHRESRCGRDSRSSEVRRACVGRPRQASAHVARPSPGTPAAT